MRRTSVLLILLSALAACGPVRDGAVRAPLSTSAADVGPLFDLPDEDAIVPRPGVPSLACLEHAAIDAWEHRLRAGDPSGAATLDVVARGAQYLTRLREIVEEEGVPASLALLPVVESGFRPEAGARDGGGGGLWQLQAHTARRFGLVVGKQRDDRFHPERSTRAAARYLRLLHDRYGDWPLALAAYNAGEGRVDRALSRRPGASFWELAQARWLPRTSCDYVPRFLAVVRLMEPSTACG